MHPILIKIGNITIYTYGLFVAIGFLTALGLAQKEARRLGEDPGLIVDLGFYMLIAAIIGARVFFLIVNPEVVLENPLAAFQIWKGGLVFYGGFIAAVITAIVFVRGKKLRFMRVADIFSPGLSAGHAIGRIGCFFAGCCYGRECELPWAVVFKDPLSLAPTGVHLHPTQLYSVAADLMVFGLLWFFRKRTTRQGQLFWLYVLLYGIIRTILELFRGDPRGFIWGGPSVAQVIGIALACVAAVALLRLWKQTRDVS
jgi:phosphatidylglycerol---prolipoprotein diacylglyceryl transferase